MLDDLDFSEMQAIRDECADDEWQAAVLDSARQSDEFQKLEEARDHAADEPHREALRKRLDARIRDFLTDEADAMREAAEEARDPMGYRGLSWSMFI